jgi:hypothetical protein
LWQKIAQTQAVTALTTVSALQPSAAAGYNSFSALYDSVRVLGLQFHTRALSGSIADIDSFAVAFDPGQSGVLPAVIDALEHRYHVGPCGVPASASGAATQGLANSSGYHTFSAKTVKEFQSSATNDLIGGNWYPSTTTSAIIGYLKPYVENSSAGTTYLTTFVCYDCEFKFRG